VTPPSRDPADLAIRLADWLHHQQPECDPFEVVEAVPADGGYSSDVVFVTLHAATGPCTGRRELVLRLPPPAPGLFRQYDLAAQAAAQDVVRAAGVPVPEFVTVEADLTWLGAPFQVMPRVAGHVPGPLASIDDWIVGLGVEGQARLQGGFLDALARVHTTPWPGTGLEERLRGAEETLVDELAWWEDLVGWTFDGAPPAPMADVLTWCRENRPEQEPPPSLLWGDVRLGNVVFGDDLSPLAVLDWEMATIGPAESDLAWYLALDEVGNEVVGRTVPGFLDRDAAVARHEAAIGRPLVAFRWFEIVALGRAAALNLRKSALKSDRLGRPRRAAEGDPVLQHAVRAISAG
jgi:aminoglycoside phosphotransferase (APT) family kinase protein